ncbi:MAG: MarR family winged helix-turn-helix transcriptional regulator, partial [Candidatus Dormibacteria bacterium]
SDPAPPPAAVPRHTLGLVRDANGRLYSPPMRERFAHLGASAPRAEVIAALSVADKKVSFLLDHTFEQVHLSLAQVRVMGIIRHVGDDGCQMRTIAMACNVTPRTTTGVVDGLEAAGLVERVPDPHDRRAVIARLTAEGERRLDAAIALQDQVSERLLEGFGAEEQEVLRDLCLRLVEAAISEVQQ